MSKWASWAPSRDVQVNRRVELTPLLLGPFGHLVCNFVVFGSRPPTAFFFARLRRAQAIHRFLRLVMPSLNSKLKPMSRGWPTPVKLAGSARASRCPKTSRRLCAQCRHPTSQPSSASTQGGGLLRHTLRAKLQGASSALFDGQLYDPVVTGEGRNTCDPH